PAAHPRRAGAGASAEGGTSPAPVVRMEARTARARTVKGRTDKGRATTGLGKARTTKARTIKGRVRARTTKGRATKGRMTKAVCKDHIAPVAKPTNPRVSLSRPAVIRTPTRKPDAGSIRRRPRGSEA